MTFEEIKNIINLDVLTGEPPENKEISSGYVSDMLSDVMANIGENSVLITILAHENTIAVASLKEIALIILVNGRKPDKKTVQKAREEDVIICSTKKNAFETAGLLYDAGLR
ncbi:MAG: DRTGG domain-containing protein [Candidatus Muiribacteriota bacterium]